MSRWMEPYDNGTHPDVGDYRDEVDPPVVDEFDPALDWDLRIKYRVNTEPGI